MKYEEGKKLPNQSNPKPVFIIMNNKRYTAYTDGKGNAYYNNGKTGYDIYEEPSLKEDNRIPEKDFEFERYLSGFDF